MVVEQGTIQEQILANPYDNHSENTSQKQLTGGMLARPEIDKKQRCLCVTQCPVPHRPNSRAECARRIASVRRLQ